jgi:hypothetical protein
MAGDLLPQPQNPTPLQVQMGGGKEDPYKISLENRRGIQNLGVSCFIGASIQLLYSIPELREFLDKIEFTELNDLEPVDYESINQLVTVQSQGIQASSECRLPVAGAAPYLDLTHTKSFIKALKLVFNGYDAGEDILGKSLNDTNFKDVFTPEEQNYYVNNANNFEYNGVNHIPRTTPLTKSINDIRIVDILLDGKPLEQDDATEYVNNFFTKFKCFFNNENILNVLQSIFHAEYYIRPGKERYTLVEDSGKILPDNFYSDALQPFILFDIVNNDAASIQALINLYTTPKETAEGEVMNKSLENLPTTKYYILTLKRTLEDGKKNEKKITTTAKPAIGGKIFKIVSALIHTGKSSGGHYYNIIYGEDGRPLLELNDKRISAIEEKDKKTTEERVDTQANVFLYRLEDTASIADAVAEKSETPEKTEMTETPEMPQKTETPEMPQKTETPEKTEMTETPETPSAEEAYAPMGLEEDLLADSSPAVVLPFSKNIREAPGLKYKTLSNGLRVRIVFDEAKQDILAFKFTPGEQSIFDNVLQFNTEDIKEYIKKNPEDFFEFWKNFVENDGTDRLNFNYNKAHRDFLRHLRVYIQGKLLKKYEKLVGHSIEPTKIPVTTSEMSTDTSNVATETSKVHTKPSSTSETIKTIETISAIATLMKTISKKSASNRFKKTRKR